MDSAPHRCSAALSNECSLTRCSFLSWSSACHELRTNATTKPKLTCTETLRVLHHTTEERHCHQYLRGTRLPGSALSARTPISALSGYESLPVVYASIRFCLQSSNCDFEHMWSPRTQHKHKPPMQPRFTQPNKSRPPESELLKPQRTFF